MPDTQRAPTPSQSALVGALSGTIEVVLQQPTVAWKNALQRNAPLPLHPRALYRGLPINAAALAPITALQFSIFTLGSRLFTTPDAPPAPTTQVALGAAAGLAAAVVAAPAERVMIEQQTNGGTFLRTAHVVRADVPFRAFWLAAARDAVFAAGYLGLAPVLAAAVARGQPDATERIVGGLGAGVVAGVLSHPFDTVKTAVQAAGRDGPHTGAEWMRREVGGKGIMGLRALYRGFVPRSVRILCGVVILQECKVRLEPLLFG